MINYEYEELMLLGMPDVPEGYRLKFTFEKTAHDYVQKYHDVIQCRAYRKIPGIWFSIGAHFIPRRHRDVYYSSFNETLLNSGALTEQEILSQTWLPEHLALLGRWVIQDDITKNIEKRRPKPKKIKEVVHVEDISNVERFLKKGMP